MKKLLFFASDYSIGLSSLLSSQVLSLKENGVDLIAVSGDKEQEKGLTDLLRSSDVSFMQIEGLDEHKRYSHLTSQIREIVRKHDIEIIHVQNNWQLAIAGMVKLKERKKQIRIIYTIHGFRNNSPIKAKIAKGIIGSGLWLLADHVVCTTEYLINKFNFLSSKISILPLGIKQKFFKKEYKHPSTDKIRIVYPAQFRKGKNQDKLINAFSRYLATQNDKTAILTLPGAGPYLEAAKQLAKHLKIDKHVLFPGLLNEQEIIEAYQSHNIAIVASNSETFGQAIVEPFVLGRCIISTPVGIAPEIIKEGENGFIIDSIDELPCLLTRIKNNMHDLEVIGRHNFDNRNLFHWDEISKQYISLFLR